MCLHVTGGDEGYHAYVDRLEELTKQYQHVVFIGESSLKVNCHRWHGNQSPLFDSLGSNQHVLFWEMLGWGPHLAVPAIILLRKLAVCMPKEPLPLPLPH